MATQSVKLPKSVKRMLAMMSNRTSATVFKNLMLEAEISNQTARMRRSSESDSDKQNNEN